MNVGIRELRDHFSAFVARVRRGEELVITEHGRPFAVLRPLRAEDDTDEWVRRLVADGLVEPAQPWRPLRARRGRLRGALLSGLVADERDEW